MSEDVGHCLSSRNLVGLVLVVGSVPSQLGDEQLPVNLFHCALQFLIVDNVAFDQAVNEFAIGTSLHPLTQGHCGQKGR